MENLIRSITELENTGNVSNDMRPFLILKKYLDKQISYTIAMKELNECSGAYKNLVKSLIVGGLINK